MNKSILLILLFAIAMPLAAQQENKVDQKKQPADITELVTGLSTAQKRKIDNISHESKVRVENLRKQQYAVRDSIRIFMERDGDQSKHLYPLFDREASIQAAISREMYATKLCIDAVLTADQRASLRKNNKAY